MNKLYEARSENDLEVLFEEARIKPQTAIFMCRVRVDNVDLAGLLCADTVEDGSVRVKIPFGQFHLSTENNGTFKQMISGNGSENDNADQIEDVISAYKQDRGEDIAAEMEYGEDCPVLVFFPNTRYGSSLAKLLNGDPISKAVAMTKMLEKYNVLVEPYIS
ncbi:MAG: hypothetical protein NTZ93_01040 [Candidatus Beckwithbacteria bacterium]|nr:hypothetical protein [Candidatus Beckwithbacteria bacterium]